MSFIFIFFVAHVIPDLKSGPPASATSGATDHKTHGSDHTTDFESRIGSFFGSAKKSCVNY